MVWKVVSCLCFLEHELVIDDGRRKKDIIPFRICYLGCALGIMRCTSFSVGTRWASTLLRIILNTSKKLKHAIREERIQTSWFNLERLMHHIDAINSIYQASCWNHSEYLQKLNIRTLYAISHWCHNQYNETKNHI